MKNKNIYTALFSIISSISLILFSTLTYLSSIKIVEYSHGGTYMLLAFIFLFAFLISSIKTIAANKKNKYSMKISDKKKRNIIIALVVIAIMYALIMALSQYYFCFGEVDGEQLYYHLMVETSGMDYGVVRAIAIPTLINTVPVSVILCYIYYAMACMINASADISKSIKTARILTKIVSVFSVCLMVAYLFHIIPIADFISYRKSAPSTFIDVNYVDPQNTNITFPEQKQNLIYIYMESMESTFANKEAGGAFEYNMIPEIMELQKDNISFSNTEKIGGMLNTHGMTYTTAGMFSTTFGIPLKLYGNSILESSTQIMPNKHNMFDILDDAGYNQYVVLGSSANFGGLQQLFDSHGNITLCDYDYMIDTGYIPKDYKVFWGVEDIKMYDFSREKLTEISKNEKPFVFVMETVDTHAPDGWVCEKCENKFPQQYSNVIACASKQVYEFVKWVQEQEWYENTTIVIVGDHLSMKNDYFLELDPNYTRTQLNLIINPHKSLEYDENVLKNREFCSMDLLPTVLSSMGCKFDGNKLGLGTNLFSGEKTIFEQYGFDYVNTEFKKKSAFYDEMFG